MQKIRLFIRRVPKKVINSIEIMKAASKKMRLSLFIQLFYFLQKLFFLSAAYFNISIKDVAAFLTSALPLAQGEALTLNW